MQTEVTRKEWSGFFEQFTLQHDGWLVRIDGLEDFVSDAPLEGIVARDGQIIISTGYDVHSHLRLVVDNPSRVTVDTSAGTECGVRIETLDGKTVALRLTSPGPPM